MKKISKAVSFALALVMVLALLAGCSSDGSSGTTTTTTTTRATTTSAGTTTTAAATTTTPEERIQMTLFMSNSGVAAPDGVDPSNNIFINIIEEYANVDLIVELPQYADYTTRLNLLLASGQLPDVLHSTGLDVTYQAARDGAFIDIYDYWEGSEVVQKYISREFLEMAKTPLMDNAYHRIPMKYDSGMRGTANFVRYDLIKKYSPTGAWPTNIDEYVATFEAYHEAEPDKIILTMRERAGMTSFWLYGGGVIPYWFGANEKYRYDYQDQKVYAQLQLPEFKAALEMINDLYKKGIYDQEFATSDSNRYNANFYDGMIAQTNTLDQLTPASHVAIRQNVNFPERAFQEWHAAPLLEQYPSSVKDTWYTIPYNESPIVFHGLYIPVTSKDHDRAWRVIEGFASDELFELYFYGIEGVTFNVVNGERVFDWEKFNTLRNDGLPETGGMKTSWGLAYMVIAGFNNGFDVVKASAEYNLGKRYFDEVMKYQTAIDTLARNKGYRPFNFIVDTERTLLKLAESEDAAKAIAIRYAMGQTTSAQYDAEVAQWVSEYGFIMEDRAAYINNNKDELLAKGVALAP